MPDQSHAKHAIISPYKIAAFQTLLSCQPAAVRQASRRYGDRLARASRLTSRTTSRVRRLATTRRQLRTACDSRQRHHGDHCALSPRHGSSCYVANDIAVSSSLARSQHKSSEAVSVRIRIRCVRVLVFGRVEIALCRSLVSDQGRIKCV